ncbi:MAG: aquaporin [Gammaproteobacteria bacterium]|nr:aquaporin [Gammaproteobacteria bacterium]
MGALQSLRKHWPEYLMEAWGLGLFMIAAGVAVILLESADSPVPKLISNGQLRLAIIGLAMGLTAVGIIYSPWGRQSGAQINPAVTLTFFRLGKIAGWDALFYVLAQFSGGTLGVLLLLFVFGDDFALPPVAYVETVPGQAGIRVAFVAEFTISLILMLGILIFMNHKPLAKYTGLLAGILVAVFITFEAPLSGMSMNPARTFASAAPAGHWTSAWIYFTAPFLGMLLAVEIYHLLRLSSRQMCAKLNHATDRRCIHCGYEPDANQGNTSSENPS